MAQRNGWDMDDVVARIFGANTQRVPGTAVILNLLVFEPGSQISPASYLDPRLGYPIFYDPAGPDGARRRRLIR